MRFEHVNYLRFRQPFPSSKNYLKYDIRRHCFFVGGKYRSRVARAAFSDSDLEIIKKKYPYYWNDPNIYLETFLIEHYKSPLNLENLRSIFKDENELKKPNF